jgi:short subunit dehydrogenase-like uncharacterized protein
VKRDLDLVVWGATGFTGELAVAYLKGDQSKLSSFRCDDPAAPADLCWAVCGRNRAKLSALDAGVEIIVCDADDRGGIESFVKRTRVVIGLAGPFHRYSDRVVEACAKYGTHWCDVSGEIPWMRSLIDRYGEQARASQACIVNQCGYDSIPSDLGTLFAVNALQSRHLEHSVDNEPKAPVRAATCYQIGLGGIGGGSLQTVIDYTTPPVALAADVDPDDPFLVGGGPQEGARSEDGPMVRAYFDSELDTWVGPFGMASVNRRIVHRSNMQLGYGPQFGYQEVEVCYSEEQAQQLVYKLDNPNPPEFFIESIESGRLPRPGQGPSLEERAKRCFLSTLVAVNEAGDDVAVTITGGDASFEETAKMVVEAGLALVYDSASCPGVLSGGGFLTPAACMGTTLIDRLHRAGIKFEVVSDATGTASLHARNAIADFKKRQTE